MQLEGTLLLERSPTRRWISIIAIVIPVVAVVILAAWFVRAFVLPPTITIASPMVTASAAPPPARSEALVAQPRQSTVRVVEPPAVRPADVIPVVPDAPPETATSVPPATASGPMFAALAVAPPNFNNLTAAPPPADTSAPAAEAAGPPPEEAEIPLVEASEPIQGPVPLPRQRPPQVSVAMVTGSVPLPRPKPVTEEAAAPERPTVDRHAID
jgi:hypothetical protein